MTRRAHAAAQRVRAARRAFDAAAARFRLLPFKYAFPQRFKIADLTKAKQSRYRAAFERLSLTNRELKAAEAQLAKIPRSELAGPAGGAFGGGAARRPKTNPAKKRAVKVASKLRQSSPSNFQQVVDARLSEAAHVLQGQGGRTGRAKFNEEGDVVGRFRGYAHAIPELAPIAPPGRLVDAIEKRRGPLYQQIRWAAENWAIKHFPQYTPHQRGIVAGPHRGNRKCKACGVKHSATAHRSHGADAFKGRREPVAPWMRAGGELRVPEELPDWVSNPRGRATEIYPASRGVQISGMRKGPGHPCDAKCRAIGHRFRHTFPENIRIFGNKDGSVVLKKAGLR